MKTYSCPSEVPAPVVDYSLGINDIFKAEKDHQIKLKEHLKAIGFTGKYTGEIYKEPIADGYALYMFADAGRSSCLIHLPYGDAWHSRNVQHIPKKEIIKRIEADKAFSEIFKKALTAEKDQDKV